MCNSFSFDGIHASDFDIWLKSIDRQMLPPMERRTVSIANKNGVYDFGDNVYGERIIRVVMFFKGEDKPALNKKARQISAWLKSQSEPKELIFDDEPDKIYFAKIYAGVTFETEIALGEAEVEFICQPFAYSPYSTGVNDTWSTANYPWETEGLTWGGSANYSFSATTQTSFTFEHPGTQRIDTQSPQTSKSKIIITGTFDNLTLQLNGKELVYGDASGGVLEIDCVELEATLDGVNVVGALNGDLSDFLPILPGENTIQIDGDNMNVSVLIDFIPEWR